MKGALVGVMFLAFFAASFASLVAWIYACVMLGLLASGWIWWPIAIAVLVLLPPIVPVASLAVGLSLGWWVPAGCTILGPVGLYLIGLAFVKAGEMAEPSPAPQS